MKINIFSNFFQTFLQRAKTPKYRKARQKRPKTTTYSGAGGVLSHRHTREGVKVRKKVEKK